ncbi:MAG: type II secretion system protein [Gammaproteobacteria bacterium]|nr:type II secretion system protein [Gammaproteobacteria bacterium]
MMMRQRPSRPKRRSGEAARSKATRGYTLIELALVVGVLGLLAIAITDFYLGQLNQDRANRRIDGTVRDVHTILDASVQWKETNVFGHWPSDIHEILTDPLVDDGNLPFIPQVRYFECPMGCGDYEITGWDRDAHPTPPRGDYVEDPMDANDLVIRFNVWGTGDARLIASQLPNGMVLPPQGGQVDTVERTIEARLTEDVAAGQYIRVRNELRPVVFGHVAGEPSGDLQGVASITVGTHNGSATAQGPGIRLRDRGTPAEAWEVGMLDDPGGARLVFDPADATKAVEAQGGLVVRGTTDDVIVKATDGSDVASLRTVEEDLRDHIANHP